MSHLVTIDPSALPALDQPIAAEKILSGAPMTGVRAAYENDAKGFYTGVWESSPGRWRISYTEDELCVILEGRVRLTADDGEVREYEKGASFVIASGFSGVWETIERVRKVYAILL
jgi:uncharacterized protein